MTRAALGRRTAAAAALRLLDPPADAATGCYRLDVVSLTATNTEESTDEIGLLHLDADHRVNMSQGAVTHPQERDLPGCDQPITRDLWEWDPRRWSDPHDSLGSVMIGLGSRAPTPSAAMGPASSCSRTSYRSERCGGAPVGRRTGTPPPRSRLDLEEEGVPCTGRSCSR